MTGAAGGPANLSPRGFRDVVGRFATGVTIMTTARDGDLHGMTVSAFAPVSLDPSLVLTCVERTSTMCGWLDDAGVFAVSILDEDAEGVATHFADPYRPDGPGQFDGIDYHLGLTGAPILDRAVASMDCRIWATYDGGDHAIVVGEVVDAALGDETAPLLFYRSAYRGIRPEGT